MVSQTDSVARESVIVVMDANRNKGMVDAVDWALKHVVRPKDAVIVVGVLRDIGKKTPSCFPMGISISGIWEKLEFSSGHAEVDPRELGEEIERVREQYQANLQPFYRQCKRNEVKLEVKLAAGLCPGEVTLKEAQNSNVRWIVLDSHLKKHKMIIYGHVSCNVAVMKGKDVATLMPSRAPKTDPSAARCEQGDDRTGPNDQTFNDQKNRDPNTVEEGDLTPLPQGSCWYSLQWSADFPREFSLSEIEVITNDFADMLTEEENLKLYEGLFQNTPVVVTSFEDDERFWSILTILSRVRHRNIRNIIGYCCTGTNRLIISDYPFLGNVELNLLCDASACNLPWRARWCNAIEIASSLRYLHEECPDGPIVHHSLSSESIAYSDGYTAMLCNFKSAKWLKDDVSCNGISTAKYPNLEEEKCLSVDVYGYGVFLVELITGKPAKCFPHESGGQSLTDWALPLLESGALTQLMDPRLKDKDDDSKVVQYMARAALLCLKNDQGRMISISEVLAVVRADQIPFDIFLISSAFIITVLLYTTRSVNCVYLMDFACYRPPDSLRAVIATFTEYLQTTDIFDRESIDFQVRVLERAGVGNESCVPPAAFEIPCNTSMREGRLEVEEVLFTAVKDLLTKHKINPKSIDILISNCSLFNPIPSITTMVMNKFGFRSDIKSFHLSGMGCSAGILSISLAKDLLKVHKNSLALVLSTEATGPSVYEGKNKSMLVTNTLFRMGGVAILLSNRKQDRNKAKYKLQHIVRTHMGFDDQSYNSVFQQTDEEGFKGVSLSRALLHVAAKALKTNMLELGPLVLPYSEQLKYGWSVIKKKIIRSADDQEKGSYVPNFKTAFEHFCIHAGGRAVIDAMEDNLRLQKEDIEASRMTLYRFGNTSSSSLWYELCYLEAKGKVKKGDRVWQLAFGSGFKTNSAVWKCISDLDPNETNAWSDRIHRYPVDVPNILEH
ncbi:hypothetical protein COLO4_11790 [Corchorus olitorius]|uniref:very-long-chain 3-oxoacyl-CoA synthase n=1 Tax=Corchorus olitorius TaxID=93759 RepID=A0A1R3K392_9ROSI|nr:hypothetical protein COLO4_11790 [Corchorus olitorius]